MKTSPLQRRKMKLCRPSLIWLLTTCSFSFPFANSQSQGYPVLPADGKECIVDAGLGYGDGSYAYNASSEHSPSNSVIKAFDFSNLTTWRSSASYVSREGSATFVGSISTTTTDGTALKGEWIQMNLPYAIIPDSFSISFSSSSDTGFPVSYSLLGSSDGNKWNILLSKSNKDQIISKDETLVQHSITSANGYRYYRLVVTEINAPASSEKEISVRISEFNVYGTKGNQCLCNCHVSKILSNSGFR